MQNILLINPWICDFAAYDLWMRPVGLLRIASLLKAHGYNISYIDFLDRHHPKIKKLIRSDDFGCGKFYKRQIPKPDKIKDVQRPYFIYGLPEELIKEEVKNVFKPDVIFMTSGMTYWYPGLEYTSQFLKKKFPDIPIVLGGIYATLLPKHAKSLKGIDYVVTGSDLSAHQSQTDAGSGRCGISPNNEVPHTKVATPSVCSQVSEILGQDVKSPENYLYPEYSLLSDTSSLVIETSKGCPFNCSYCGSKQLNKSFVQRAPEEVVEEIEFYRKNYGVKDIAFYDDALLVNADEHIIPIMDGVLEREIAVNPHTKGFPARQDLAGGGVGVNFHTPNGLHVRFIDKKLAKKLKEANFKTITLSFETINPVRQRNTGGKVTTEEFKTAIENLKSVGYSGREIGVYLMMGMPYQGGEEVKEGIEFLHKLKIHITLVTYSLVPNTMDAKALLEKGIISTDLDPLWHNDTIFPLVEGNFSLEEIRKLRNYVSILNRKL